jgi:hypothetical protein
MGWDQLGKDLMMHVHNDFSYDMLDTLAKRIVTLSKGVLTYEYMKETE